MKKSVIYSALCVLAALLILPLHNLAFANEDILQDGERIAVHASSGFESNQSTPLVTTLIAEDGSLEATNVFSGGTGSIDDPYQIESAQQLNSVRDYADAHYLLLNDIAFSADDFANGGQYYNDGSGWIPIGTAEEPFVGSFNGNNHSISGLVINPATPYAGLFGYTSNASIENLDIGSSIDAVTKTTSSYVGALVGYMKDTNILGCSSSGTLSSTLLSTTTTDAPHYIGGLVGYMQSGKIADSSSSAQITVNMSNGSFGGIVGETNGEISRCTFTGSSSTSFDSLGANVYMGGIAGVAVSIGDCNNEGIVYARGHAGGIAGKATGTCSNCTNRGSVSSVVSEACGIAAVASKCEDCKNYGEIISTSNQAIAAGIAGNGIAENCINYASIKAAHAEDCNQSASSNAGGILISGNAIYCVNYGNVTAFASYLGKTSIGGIQSGGGSVVGCINIGTVTIPKYQYTYGDACLGGIAGANSEIQESINIGHVYSSNSYTYTGGITGIASKTVHDCYNIGRIKGSCSAGICGINKSTITNVYNVGKANYGIASSNQGSIANAFFSDEVSQGVGNDEYLGDALTLDQLNNAASFSGFDFDSIWDIDAFKEYKFPILKNASKDVSQWDISYGDAGHTWDNEYTIDKPATCTAEGSESIHCLECGDSKTDSIRSIDMLPHDYSEWAVIKDASCLEAGLKERSCADCGYVESSSISELGHDFVVSIQPATCLDAGFTMHKCSRCDDYFIDNEVNALGHSWGSQVYEWDPDLSHVTAMRICAHDATHIESETADTVMEIETAATCTTSGIARYTASFENPVFEGQLKTAVIDPISHSWDSGKVTKPATYDASGVCTYTCTQCGSIKTEAIPVLKRTSLSGATISGLASKTYTGKAIQPAPAVKVAGKTLKSGTDYTVAYKNNVKVGTATVTVTGKGAYSGSKSASFAIVKAANPMTVKVAKKTVKLAKVKKKAQVVSKAIVISKAQGTVTYTKVSKGSSKQLTINKNTGKIAVKKGTKKGTYKIKVKVAAKGNANYKAGSKTVTAKIVVK